MNDNLHSLLQQHEYALLTSFRNLLPDKSKMLFDQQLNAVGVVQREPGGFVANMYSKKLFGAKQLSCEAFQALPSEAKVATGVPRSNEPLKIQGKIWFIEGRLFSIEFTEVQGIESIKEWTCELHHKFD